MGPLIPSNAELTAVEDEKVLTRPETIKDGLTKASHVNATSESRRKERRGMFSGIGSFWFSSLEVPM
jgi:hypothetical protein